jgi:hypothetical protein
MSSTLVTGRFAAFAAAAISSLTRLNLAGALL